MRDFPFQQNYLFGSTAILLYYYQARVVCTKKSIIIICCAIPILCFLTYAYLLTNMTEGLSKEGYTRCKPRQTQGKEVFKAIIQVWITAYFFIPAFIIVLLNGAIVWRLKVAGEMQSHLTGSKNYKLCSCYGCFGTKDKSKEESKSMQGVR